MTDEPPKQHESVPDIARKQYDAAQRGEGQWPPLALRDRWRELYTVALGACAAQYAGTYLRAAPDLDQFTEEGWHEMRRAQRGAANVTANMAATLADEALILELEHARR